MSDKPMTFIRRFLAAAPASVVASVAILAVLAISAVLAGQICGHAPEAVNLMNRLKPPVPFSGSAFNHLLGTDELGRDILSRLLHGMRISFLIALAGTVAGASIGLGLGFMAAHFRGLVDDMVLTAIDFNAALPFIIMALAMLAFFGSQIYIIIAIMAVYGWDRYARLARNLSLSALTEGYAGALLALGASPGRIYIRHILPNIAGVLIVNMTLNFPGTILLETSLSFLGVGVQPPLTSLGVLLGFGRDYLTTAWWIAVAPGTVIVMVTLSITVLGDFIIGSLDGTYSFSKSDRL
ncbi:MAG: ABC transporter permease [Candidatus Adiutrix sp.]|jgi:peptide/nickel transport system permease protein|nr:ABC transporter permease [Candidatus Adiutrix sp.]